MVCNNYIISSYVLYFLSKRLFAFWPFVALPWLKHLWLNVSLAILDLTKVACPNVVYHLTFVHVSQSHVGRWCKKEKRKSLCRKRRRALTDCAKASFLPFPLLNIVFLFQVKLLLLFSTTRKTWTFRTKYKKLKVTFNVTNRFIFVRRKNIAAGCQWRLFLERWMSINLFSLSLCSVSCTDQENFRSVSQQRKNKSGRKRLWHPVRNNNGNAQTEASWGVTQKS